MKSVLLDANVWISFLLGPRPGSAIDQVARIVLAGDFELVAPQELLDELRLVYANSTYLRERIPGSDFDVFMSEFLAGARMLLSTLGGKTYTRDPKDDYLIEYALMHDIDFLVTGDQDLLAVKPVGRLQIVTPRQFLELLQ